MRAPLFVSMTLLAKMVFGLEVLAIKAPLIDATPYLMKVEAVKEDILPALKGDSRLPVKSTVMSPGLVAKKRVTASGSLPLFLVGDDVFSRHWLKTHAEQLHQMGAIGFVTNVDNESSLKELEALAGRGLQPVSIEDARLFLSLTHYPLVMEGDCVWQ